VPVNALLFSVAGSIFAAIVISAIPGIRAGRIDLAEALRAEQA
jgi:ABC-type antimicrobial peptide transport system permease subunit